MYSTLSLLQSFHFSSRRATPSYSILLGPRNWQIAMVYCTVHFWGDLRLRFVRCQPRLIVIRRKQKQSQKIKQLLVLYFLFVLLLWSIASSSEVWMFIYLQYTIPNKKRYKKRVHSMTLRTLHVAEGALQPHERSYCPVYQQDMNNFITLFCFHWIFCKWFTGSLLKDSSNLKENHLAKVFFKLKKKIGWVTSDCFRRNLQIGRPNTWQCG